MVIRIPSSASPDLALALVLAYWFFPSVRKMGLVRARAVLAAHRDRAGEPPCARRAEQLRCSSVLSGRQPWYFGDAVFILEPSLWLILGVAVAWNGRTRTARLAVALPMLVLLCTIASTGAMPLESVAALAIVGGLFAWVAFRLSPHTRAAAALAVFVMIVAGFAGTSRVARRAAVDALAPELRGQIVDVILTPNPSSPLCWAVIAIEMREADGEYVLWRGTLSLAPAWKAPDRLRLAPVPRAAQRRGSSPTGDWRCATPSISRFGGCARSPNATAGCARGFDSAARPSWKADRFSICDSRTAPAISSRSCASIAREGCPPNVPNWAMPRADLLE